MEILLKLPLEDLLKYAKDAVHTGEKGKNDNLEKAARVITALKGDLTHAVANESADILKRRPKDAAKQLLALVEKVEGPKTVEGDKAKEWLTKIFASGHLELVIAAVGAEIAHLENLDQAEWS